MISAHITFSKHWSAISCTEFLFVLPFGCYIPLGFFSLFAKYERRISVHLLLFRIAHYMQISYYATSGDLAAPSTDPQRPTGITFKTSYFVSTKILWYFVNFLLTSEWVEDANWTNTHTHTNDATAERNISSCVWSFETCVFYLVSYSMFRYVEVIPVLHVFFVNCPVTPFVHIFVVVYIFGRVRKIVKSDY